MVEKMIAVALLVAALGGCAMSPALTGNMCSVGPFIGDPGASTRLTRAEKEYVVALNGSGERICGWTPPR